MKHLTLQGKNNLSDIYIGASIENDLLKLYTTRFSPSKVHIITDTNVAPLYLSTVSKQFDSPVSSSIITAGEENKTLNTVSNLYEDLFRNGITRKDLIIALGGGVVGDIAGFVASSYLRGIDICQIPTTLLSQVDSSVGGKCGVDLPWGKNLVGAFYQPSLVIIDPIVLTSLSDEIFSDGLAEVIKYGLIKNKTILDMILNDNFHENIEQIIYECVKIKRDVVSEDENDTGLRMILNYGHTIGHAAEKLGGYKDLTHGQAVAVGIVAASKIATKIFNIPDLTNDIIKILEKFGLPTKLNYSVDDVYNALLSDKKKMDDEINFILVPSFGEYKIKKIKTEELYKIMKEVL